jgi:hypothetical protein
MAASLERLDDLLSAQEADVRAAFLEFVKTVRSEQVLRSLIDHLEAGDVEGALKIVESYVVRMAGVIPQIFAQVGAFTMAEVAADLPALAMAVSFDPTWPRAADLVRQTRLDLIAQFTEQQRGAAQLAIAEGLRRGLGPEQVGRGLRDSIGLTTNQESYVESYRRQLETADQRALDRQLRDRRFDERVAQAQRKPLTPRQIDTMVDRYRAGWIQLRASTIARTQALRAMSEARDESLKQMADQTGISTDRITRKWHAVHDGRTRDWHRSMDGQTAGVDEFFTDGLGNSLMFPGDPLAPPETVINCRCTLTFEVAPPA